MDVREEEYGEGSGQKEKERPFVYVV